MRVFFRSAPVFVALSVALAGCSEADSQAAKNSTVGKAKPSSESATASADLSANEVCLTVEGMS
jgi:hypothetical protein